MPDTLATARRILELAEIMRRPHTPGTIRSETFMDAAEEWGRIIASDWPEDVAKELLRQEKGSLS